MTDKPKVVASEKAQETMSESNRPPSRLFDQIESTPAGVVGHFGPHVLSSHFQPIYSLSHMRLVGHEALLRAHDQQGRAVPPLDVFHACRDDRTLAACDRLSRMIHLGNYARQNRQGEWLFLNIHPDVFQLLAKGVGASYLQQVCEHFGVPCEHLVIEVLEVGGKLAGYFDEAIPIARSLGIQLAIDDFGAGHSNFDRVWQIKPDIVKLDRSLVTKAASDRRAQRIVAQMVSLLHECGAMVLMEGVETVDEALLALDSDADMVQGYFFGRPQPLLAPAHHEPESLHTLYENLRQLRHRKREEHQTSIAPVRQAIERARDLLLANHPLEEACQAFLALPQAEVCYLLDADGHQIGHNLWSPQHQPAPGAQASPLLDAEGACWSRRPYFRRAVDHIDHVQITRPYRTLTGTHQCVTASVAFRSNVMGEEVLRVLCGDIMWDGV
ncbi:MAG TPA: EAL domain-containing protein [Aquabacterium sp.]|nr:EAL domain-containing protein [Aquabacterium sp.]